MKSTIFVATLIVAAMTTSADAEPDEPDGRRILQAVVAALPTNPLDISGDLLVRKRRGVPVHKRKFEINLNWGALPPVAEYTIRDGFGTALERLRVSHPKNADEQIEFAVGATLSPTNPPPLFTTVQDTDFTWADLTLSFLWWDNGKRVGSDKVRGRDCYIVDVPAPPENNITTGAIYDHVRLWIDKEILLVLKAEGRDKNAAPIRRMWVRSFKKINDQWMIKDMEIQAFPADQRTKMTIREVNAAE